MSKIPCSVPILTLNSKRHMEELLPLLASIFDDVFLLDGNSTDGTREIAESLGVPVYKQVETDEPNVRIQDFSAMRLRSWGLAKYDWIFVLDADEVPSVEMCERIRKIVEENDIFQAHRFSRLVKLANRRVVERAFFYPDYGVIRLFNRKSGITLVKRKVHERFEVPEGVFVVDHSDTFTNEWPEPKIFWKKMMHYQALEATTLASDWFTLFRWIIWYNIRFAIGQSLKAFYVTISAYMHNQSSLPWVYNFSFIAYRFFVMKRAVRLWLGKRCSANLEN